MTFRIDEAVSILGASDANGNFSLTGVIAGAD